MLTFDRLPRAQMLSWEWAVASKVKGRQCMAWHIERYDGDAKKVKEKKYRISLKKVQHYSTVYAWAKRVMQDVRGVPEHWMLRPCDDLDAAADQATDGIWSTVVGGESPPESTAAGAETAASSQPSVQQGLAAAVTPEFGAPSSSASAAASVSASGVGVKRDRDDSADDVAAASSVGASPAAAAHEFEGETPSFTHTPRAWMLQKALRLRAGFKMHVDALGRFKIPRNPLCDTKHSTTYRWLQPGCCALVVKVYKRDMEFEFLTEVDFLSRLCHPGIIQLFDVGMLGDKPCVLTMYGGETLAWFIRREDRRMPRSGGCCYLEDNFGSLVAQMLAGLAYLHEQQIMHRDIKPGNIVVDSDGVVRLIDFGSAGVCFKDLRSEHTTADRVGILYATWPYRAIELLLGCDAHTTAVDIWSMACVIFEMITLNWFVSGLGESPSSADVAKFCFSQLYAEADNPLGCIARCPLYRPTMLGEPSAANFFVRMRAHAPLGVTCADFVFSMFKLDYTTRPSAAFLATEHFSKFAAKPAMQ